MIWVDKKMLAPRGEQEHRCEAMTDHPRQDAFIARHRGLHIPCIDGGVRVIRENGEWILAIAGEFAVAVRGCPFCSEKLA